MNKYQKTIKQFLMASKKVLGFVPNLFAAFAHSETALADCFTSKTERAR